MLDIIRDLPPLKGATMILVVVDMLTKMAHVQISLPQMAHLFIAHMFWLNGLPD